MKVAWICPFETNIYADKYGLPKTRVLAPWITTLVLEFQKMNGIELHIVTPMARLKNAINFNEEGILFHLIPSGIQFLGRGLPSWLPLNLITNYSRLRRKLNALINEIHPDIVHLHGTENNYSPAILDIDSPAVISIQGLAHNRRDRGIRSWETEKKVNIEAEIFRKKENFIVRLPLMERIIREYNPQAKIFYSTYALNSEVFKFDSAEKPEVDVIFAARITREKGIEDLLAALAIVKKKWRPITIRVIGSCTKKYHRHLMREISRFGLIDEVDFIGYLEDQRMVFSHIKKAKIYVLPTHFDTTPGTVTESMVLGTPVIAYDVGGLSMMIENHVSGLLVQKGDISGLADAIIELLQDLQKRDKFTANAKKNADCYRSQTIAREIIDIYNKILQRSFL